MAYSIDFRKKVLSYCERTGSITEASHVFQISRNTIYGWLKLKEKTGELNHQVKGTKPRKVDRDRLKNYLTNNPDAYLTEIASEFDCHPTTIHYALKAMGYTRKRRYQRISLVAGLTNGELIAPMTYEETMTSDFFEAWFQKFLLPTLNTPSVIIMDNARFHRMGKLELLCEEFGHKLLPLPPYSPEYNPIEKTWAHIKKHLKKVLPSCNTFYEALLSSSYFN